MNSGTVFAGTAGLTTMKSGTLITQATGAMSRKKEKLRLWYSVVLIAGEASTTRSVYPSGADFTTASVAILVPAPAQFSTTKGWPRRSESCWLIKRATTSAVPPGG